MISLLVVDGTGRLIAHLQPQGAPVEGFEILGAKDPVEAIGILEEHDVCALVIDGRSPDLDPLAVTTWALRFKPELRLVFVTDGPMHAPAVAAGPSFGPIFVDRDALGSELGLIFRQNGNRGHSKSVVAVDALDVSRIAGLRKSSGAVQVFGGANSGTLRFEDGVLVHAACGMMSGSDAFFSMMLWPRGDIQRLSDEEAEDCERNVWFPSEFLIQEAERFHSALQGGGEGSGEYGADGVGGDRGGEDRAAVWRRLARVYPSGVRVVVACSNRCQGSCLRRVMTELGDALEAGVPWMSEAAEGPSFARVHAASGGTLAVTRVPAGRRNDFLFETLSRNAEITILCGANAVGRKETVEKWAPNTAVWEFAGDPLESTDVWTAVLALAGDDEE